MSDLHLTRDGSPIWGEYTHKKFAMAIKQIKNTQDIDVIIVSGDISDDGSMESYEFADNMFLQTDIPTYWCLGNHDDLELQRMHKFLKHCKLIDNIKICGWIIILLNSVAPDEELLGKNRSRGILSTQTLTRLNEKINNSDAPTIVALHHPALEIGGWQDNKILKDREAFRKMLESSKNVRIVLSGHVHEFSDIELNGIRYSTATGLGFAFSSKMQNYELLRDAEGYSVITIDGNDISIDNTLLDSNK